MTMDATKGITFPDLTEADWQEIDSCMLSDELAARIEAGGEEPALAMEDWRDIHSAVREKLAALRAGFYGRDRCAKDWTEHMREILQKLDTVRVRRGRRGKVCTDVRCELPANHKGACEVSE